MSRANQPGCENCRLNSMTPEKQIVNLIFKNHDNMKKLNEMIHELESNHPYLRFDDNIKDLLDTAEKALLEVAQEIDSK